MLECWSGGPMVGKCLLWVASEVLSFLCVVVMANAMSIGWQYAFLFTGIWCTVAGVEFACGLLLILEMLHLLDLELLPLFLFQWSIDPNPSPYPSLWTLLLGLSHHCNSPKNLGTISLCAANIPYLIFCQL